MAQANQARQLCREAALGGRVSARIQCCLMLFIPPENSKDGCEILRQLIDGKHPVFHQISTKVMQDLAAIHSCP